MILISISSGIVNALIFIFVDLISLWAFHRGLLAVQGYMLYRHIKRGHRVQLRRSRIPIVSGELLVNQTRFPHILVIANALFIALAFIATFGVNGQTMPRLVPTPLAYVSRIRADPKLDYDKQKRLRPRIFLQCRFVNRTTQIFWPGAFNVSNNARLVDPYAFLDASSVARMVNSSTLRCQHGKGDSNATRPMFVVTDCAPAASGCTAAIEPRSAMVRFYGKNTTARAAILRGLPELNWHDERFGTADLGLIAIHRTLRASSDKSVAQPGDRVVCFEISPRGSDLAEGEGRLNCLLFKWERGGKVANVSFGRIFIKTQDDYKRIDVIDLRLEVTTASGTVRWDVERNGEKFFADGLRDLGVSSYSLADVMDNIVSRAVTAYPLRGGDVVYTEIDKSVTEIESYSFVILVVLVVCAALMVGVKEMLICAFKGLSGEMENALGANRYDTLSQMLRGELERHSKRSMSGRSAELYLLSNDGESRIGPTFSDHIDSEALGSSELRVDYQPYATGDLFAQVDSR